MTKSAFDLQSKLKKADPTIRNYVHELESENEKLQRQIAKLQVHEVSSDNRIKALEKALKEDAPQVHINVADFRLTEEQMIEKAIGALEERGYIVTRPS